MYMHFDLSNNTLIHMLLLLFFQMGFYDRNISKLCTNLKYFSYRFQTCQVEATVTRAKERLSQLGLRIPPQKHHGKGCLAYIRKHIQELKDNVSLIYISMVVSVA